MKFIIDTYKLNKHLSEVNTSNLNPGLYITEDEQVIININKLCLTFPFEEIVSQIESLSEYEYKKLSHEGVENRF